MTYPCGRHANERTRASGTDRGRVRAEEHIIWPISSTSDSCNQLCHSRSSIRYRMYVLITEPPRHVLTQFRFVGVACSCSKTGPAPRASSEYQHWSMSLLLSRMTDEKEINISSLPNDLHAVFDRSSETSHRRWLYRAEPLEPQPANQRLCSPYLFRPTCLRDT